MVPFISQMAYAHAFQKFIRILGPGHGKGDILGQGHVRKQCIILGKQPDAAGLGSGFQPGGGIIPAGPLKMDISAVQGLKPGNAAQNGCLAGAGRAGQHDGLAGSAGNRYAERI